MINSRLLLSFMFLVMSINVLHAFALTESFSVSPNAQKSFDIVLHENQKVFFQIFVDGGENDDIRLKITNSDTNFVYFDSIIRANNPDTGYDSTIFPAYKNEITNNSNDVEHLTVLFDNSLSTHGSKNVDFAYAVFTDSGAYFEQTAFWSWIYALVIIVVIAAIVIIVVAIVIKKRKYK